MDQESSAVVAEQPKEEKEVIETEEKTELDKQEVVSREPKADSVKNAESDTEEAGYKSDKSASDEGSTDNVVDRRRSKGSSGYEESDDGREEEGSDVSESHRASNNEEEGEYDKEVSENDSSDDVEESDEEGETEGYEEDKEDESKDEAEGNAGEDDEEKDPKNPALVPRRTGFWNHDDRYDEIPVEESREPQGNRKLWDRTVDSWQHDKYVDEEQAPKEDWEIEETLRNYEEGRSRRGRGGRGDRRNLGDFVARRGQGGRGRGRGGGGGRDRDTRERAENRSPEHRRPYREGYDNRRHNDENNDRLYDKDGEKRSVDRPEKERRGTEEHHDSRESRRGNSRGQPRGRANARGRARPERQDQEWLEQVKGGQHWGADEEEEPLSPKTTKRNDKDARQEDVVRKEREKEAVVATDEHKMKSSRGKRENEPSRQEHASEEKEMAGTARQKSTPAANKKQEHKDPRGRGKGIASNKIASAHKTARDYGKETKKSQEALDQQKEDIYEDADVEVEVEDQEDSENMTSKHPAVKPKRYSSQRQRQTTAEESLPQTLEENPAAQNAQYYDPTQQQSYQQPQGVVLNPTMLMFLQQMQQMQLMQQQQQQMQPRKFEGQQQQQQQQVPAAPNQGAPVATPEMQQYIRFQNFQAMFQQQQQQLQQQQLQQQQAQGMRVRQPAMPGSESQQATPDGGILMQQRPSYPAVAPNMQHYNIMQQTPQAIYPQSGPQYEVLVDQVMQGRQQAPAQQPGLYIPSVQQIPQQPEETIEQYGQRRLRPAAIPIKPPPEVQ